MNQEKTLICHPFRADYHQWYLLQVIHDASAIAVRDTPLSEKVLSAAPNLRVVSRHGFGFDNIPLDYCTNRGIPVTIVGPVNAILVAEHTVFLMPAAARVGVELDSAARKGRFSARGDVRSLELRGKALFLVGFCRIGQEVARRASAFGMRIIAFDPYFKGDTDLPVTFAGSISEGLQQADMISLHLPLTEETRNILGKNERSHPALCTAWNWTYSKRNRSLSRHTWSGRGELFSALIPRLQPKTR